MTAEQAKKLREPFAPELIGKLPKPTKADNPKGTCKECGKWHGLPAVHLDYVGHAATTDRLLSVDPGWSWEPMAFGPNGEPLMTNGGMWIWLTVCGVRRPGFGDGKSPKEVIGDAIRNAAMRFGVALDLWAKEDLHADEASDKPAASPAAGSTTPVAPAATPPAAGATSPTAEALAEYGLMCEAWKKVSPAFDVPEAEALARTKDNAWVLRATKRLQQNVDREILAQSKAVA